MADKSSSQNQAKAPIRRKAPAAKRAVKKPVSGKSSAESNGKATSASRENLAQRIVTTIDNMIASGELRPGQRIVETELAERLEVSRLPVREALRILAGDGVVEIVPNRGALVREFQPFQLSDMLKVLIGHMCMALDELKGRPEAQRRLLEQSERIESARVAGDAVGAFSELITFHELAIGASANSFLQQIAGKAHMGNYKGQALNTFPHDLLLEASRCFYPAAKALRKDKVSDAKKLLNKSLENFLLAFNERQIEDVMSSRPPVGRL
ncbi:regulatory protein, gntR family [Sphingobium faniae]|nr:regulatory protein, gntR family [Sphingobium faniae]